jgi:hypothetical protein
VLAGKEETPKCRKKTVTWTNEMIEDLIDFIEIHPIVAFEAIYEPMLTSFRSLISFAVQLYIIMQYKGQHPPLLPKMPFCLLYLPPKLVYSSKFLASCILIEDLHRSIILVIQVECLIQESLKPGIHDTSFASKSPFKKTWIKKT